ncbi:enoyl-CoA hydratase/isomerase family protein [Silvimonas iriomotensis]|uniref:3-hydroxyisobutyryl-CoA hydrolase n=1 Tax=Silvimonas iriomotensis TaxID=449662 RepID=A0ABQ2PDV7_9NEIS|nr:enoyl-CoA hydratase/isomerase family protein [Silvimonas iriomotensis]GGP23340.1 enoyl-CoA hydratase [Silvimonas iriomotensis]
MVRFQFLPTRHGARIAEILLDTPGTLNAQNLAMVREIRTQLELWRDDASVVAVLMRGVGEKAFCAGGDIKALYYAMTEPGRITEADDFFAEEYALCRELHRYPKPVLAWGNGVVMGGGWGLLAGASHRVVTEISVLAMPEIGIGLFPDVGASDWLGRLKLNVGRMLFLTASRLNAADALAAGAADWALPATSFEVLLQGLDELPWTGHGQTDAAMLSQLLEALSSALPCPLPPAQWEPVQDLVAELVAGDDLLQITRRIAACQTDNVWITQAQKQMATGSPNSIVLSWTLAQRAQGMDYDAVVAMETLAARHSVRHGDFSEGVRARLIDRDNQPRWQDATVEEALARGVTRWFDAV